jgi:nucleolar protein 4
VKSLNLSPDSTLVTQHKKSATELAEDAQAIAKGKLTVRILSDVCPLEHRKRKCRVILRNLSFQATEQNIATKLSKFGPLVEVLIPRVAVASTKPASKSASASSEENATKLKPRGFAFVTFLCENDAKQAVNGGCAGLKICNREIAIDFCQNKHTFTTDYGVEMPNPVVEKFDSEDKVAVVDDVRSDSGESSAGDEGKDTGEDASDGGESEGDEDDESEDENVNQSDGSVSEEEGNDDEEEETSEGDKTEQVSDVKEGRTVFVRWVMHNIHYYISDQFTYCRDLPFDCTEGDIKKAFKRFGDVDLVAIVKGKNFVLYTFNIVLCRRKLCNQYYYIMLYVYIFAL